MVISHFYNFAFRIFLSKFNAGFFVSGNKISISTNLKTKRLRLSLNRSEFFTIFMENLNCFFLCMNMNYDENNVFRYNEVEISRFYFCEVCPKCRHSFRVFNWKWHRWSVNLKFRNVATIAYAYGRVIWISIFKITYEIKIVIALQGTTQER